MDELQQVRAVFFQECVELLVEIEQASEALSDGAMDAEAMNALFRAVHSIKGGAGAFGYDRLVRFAHRYENTLDRIRSGELELTSALGALCVRAGDILSDLVEEIQGGTIPQGREDSVLRELEALCAHDDAPLAEPGLGDFEFPVTSLSIDLEPTPLFEPPAGIQGFEITFRPEAGAYARACEPRLIFRELSVLGTLSIECESLDHPEFSELDPGGSYLKWHLRLETPCPREEVEAAFEFVLEDCELSIAPINALADPSYEPVQGLGDLGQELSALLDLALEEQGAGGITESIAPHDFPASPPRLSDLTASEGLKSAKAPPLKKANSDSPQSIRVDVEKIDRLVDMVGELVIAHAVAHQQLGQALDPKDLRALQSLETLAQHMRSLQESVMAIRAQPVRSVFSRMGRLVRDLADKTGKQIRLETSGDEVEIDKSVLESLVDPLTHMIRNAADHGLESPEKRLATGKMAEGSIHLVALQRAGRLVVEIHDDGAGINREKVLAKAVEKGLVNAEARLNDDEIDRLIFRPGFSTVDQVSDLSGRGVGMDVVLQNIQKLGGAVTVRSQPGLGTTVSLILPLTLAVLDATIVRIGQERFVIPLAVIVENLALSSEVERILPSGARLLALRGEHMPIVDVSQVLGVPGDPRDQARKLAVVVETEDGAHAALEVDDVLGQQQVVVKSLDGVFGRPVGASGATILGDGKVALILDVSDLRRHGAALSGQIQTLEEVAA